MNLMYHTKIVKKRINFSEIANKNSINILNLLNNLLKNLIALDIHNDIWI